MSLFGSKSKQEILTDSDPEPVRNYEEYRSNQNSGALFNVITPGTKIIGTFKSEKDIRLDGTMEGDIECDGKVVISSTGLLKGTLTCKNAEVLGKIDGKIVVEVLNLHPTSNIVGEIAAKTLIMESGAIFNGTFTMTK